MSERIAIGLDAGGTSTVAACSRDGVFARDARGGPANLRSRGLDAAVATICDLVRTLLGDREPDALFVAAAGVGSEKVRRAMRERLLAAFRRCASIVVEDDVRIALRAAIPHGAGVVLIAGTGSVAYAEHDGRSVRAGGDGYLLGDEGSAYAIGLAALKLLARTFDGRAREDETTAIAARHFAVSDREDLLDALYGAPLDVARVAALAPSVLAFAGKGNRASTKIVQGAALELGELVRAAIRASGLTDRSPEVALAGGLLRENSMLSFLLETRIVNETPGVAIVRAREEPVRAALRFAEASNA